MTPGWAGSWARPLIRPESTVPADPGTPMGAGPTPVQARLVSPVTVIAADPRTVAFRVSAAVTAWLPTVYMVKALAKVCTPASPAVKV